MKKHLVRFCQDDAFRERFLKAYGQFLFKIGFPLAVLALGVGNYLIYAGRWQ